MNDQEIDRLIEEADRIIKEVKETDTIAELKKEIDKLKEMVHLREGQMKYNKIELELALRREAERYDELLKMYWKVDKDKDYFRDLSEALQRRVVELSELLQAEINRNDIEYLRKAVY